MEVRKRRKVDETTGVADTPTEALSDGNHALTVTATDAAGNKTQAASDAMAMTVDTTAPAQPTITTTTSLTNNATPTIRVRQKQESMTRLLMEILLSRGVNSR